MLITDERNALERAMLHFAHFEKQAERTDDGRYILRLKYYENDETEIVIRVLSFRSVCQGSGAGVLRKFNKKTTDFSKKL